MTIVLCSDDISYLKEAESIVGEYEQEHGFSFVIKVFRDGEILCAQGETQPAILFLDIQSNAQRGVETAQKVNIKWPKCRIIFLAESFSIAADVYQARHIYFILKPQLREMIEPAMEKALRDIGTDDCMLMFHAGKSDIALRAGEILFFERSLHKTTIVTPEETYETREKLSDIAKKLPVMMFVRSHNSYLVAVSAIRKMGKNNMELVNGKAIPISRQHQKEVKAAFAQWMTAHS